MAAAAMFVIVYGYLPKTGRYHVAAVVVAAKGHDNLPGLRDKGRAVDTHPVRSSPVASKRVKKTAAAMEKNGLPEKAGKKDARPQYRPGEIIVRFKPKVSIARINELNAFIGAKIQKKLSHSNIYKLGIDDDSQVPKALEFYKASGLVISVGRNLLRYKMSGPLPDDPYFSDKWGLAIADARDAWKIEKGDSSVVVGVIDTGIDYMHPDLADNMWINEAEKNGRPGVDDDGNGYVDDIYGYDFADDDADPMDNDGHGTHVAGIIGAIGNNGIGVAGVCRHVKLMALKVQGDSATDMDEMDILEAMEYGKDKGVRIFNCSYGGAVYSKTEFHIMGSFKAQNGIFICAAGNDGKDTDNSEYANFPSGYDLDNIISVAASTGSDTLAGFSNYGRKSVDLMAPGYDILSTYPGALAPLNSETIIGAVITIKNNGERLDGNGMEFAATTGSDGIHGLMFNCGYGYTDEIPDKVNGNIALVKRGGRNNDAFYFFQKVENLQAKGATGAVIYNNEPGNFNGTMGSLGNWIPTMSMSNHDGLLLLGLLPAEVKFVSGAYATLSGTSMAAPFVTGLAALMVSKKPGIDYHRIISGILDNVDPVPGVSDKLVSGGRVNFYHSLGIFLIPGDINGDGRVGLDDLILCIQILVGAANDNLIVFHPKNSDVDGDRKIGLPEAAYILRKTAGLP